VTTVLNLESEERNVLIQALDRYVAALSALRTLDNREGKAAESDRAAAIAAALRDRLDGLPERDHHGSDAYVGELSDGTASVAPLRRVGVRY
jgi:hypothetical protein